MAWRSAKLRCYSANNHDYPYYGGRGIYMVDAWKDSFAQFLSDMGPRPKGYTLDRIDVDGPYSPENCRWASRYVQSNNTRQCRYVMHKGERMTLAQLAVRYDIDYGSLRRRCKAGQTAEQAIFALLHGRKRKVSSPNARR